MEYNFLTHGFKFQFKMSTFPPSLLREYILTRRSLNFHFQITHMAQFNLIRGIKVSRITTSTVLMPSSSDNLKATVTLKVEGAIEVISNLLYFKTSQI